MIIIYNIIYIMSNIIKDKVDNAKLLYIQIYYL